MLARRAIVLAWMAALTVSAGGAGRADAGSFTLANGYVRLSGEGTHLTGVGDGPDWVAVDPMRRCHWVPATELGRPPVAPWGEVGTPEE
jgi:hypothetical protein